MSNWNDNPDMIKAFEAAASSAAVEAGAAGPGTTTKFNDLFLDWLEYANKSLSDFPNMADALSSFKWWIDNARHMPTTVHNESTLSVKITMHTGKMSVEFGADRTFNIESAAHRQAGYEALSRAVMKDLTGWVSRHAGAMGPLAAGASGGGVAQVEQVISVQTLVHEYANDQHRFKVRGGNFTKWGVPVYPEVLEAWGTNPANIPMGELAFDGSARILMNGNKPKKVVELSGSLL